MGLSATFDADAEGWTSEGNGGGGLSWESTGGNPDGHLKMDDVNNGWGYFKAPTISQPLLYGGSFSFDLRHEGVGSNVYNVRVALQGAGLTLINESVLPTDSWATYSFTMDENTGWRKFSDLAQNYSNAEPAASQAEVQSVLAAPTGLFIAADYNDFSSSGQDETYLDNVNVDAVPEPATMVLAGAAGLAWLRRRKTSA